MYRVRAWLRNVCLHPPPTPPSICVKVFDSETLGPDFPICGRLDHGKSRIRTDKNLFESYIEDGASAPGQNRQRQLRGFPSASSGQALHCVQDDDKNELCSGWRQKQSTGKTSSQSKVLDTFLYCIELRGGVAPGELACLGLGLGGLGVDSVWSGCGDVEGNRRSLRDGKRRAEADVTAALALLSGYLPWVAGRWPRHPRPCRR